jgi:methionine-rich copper-binding protein CopC
MQERKVVPRATITKSMPLQDYERMQAPAPREMSFEEKMKAMSQQVLLRHFQDQFQESLKDKRKEQKQDVSTLETSTNNSLIRE